MLHNFHSTSFSSNQILISIYRTARKIGFTLNLILIKVEVKYDYRFDLNFDARQMCVKNVMALPIHLLLDKEEGKRDLTFDSTFDARQRRNQIS